MFTDTKWNRIFKLEQKKWTAYCLHLAGEQYSRKLWILQDWIFKIKRDRERHLLQKNNSYGFNDYFLRNILNPETKIEITEKWSKLKLRTTVSKIIEEWTYLYFLTQWFEKQVFLKLSLFDIGL